MGGDSSKGVVTRKCAQTSEVERDTHMLSHRDMASSSQMMIRIGLAMVVQEGI